jgi:penicillin-binding protein 2
VRSFLRSAPPFDAISRNHRARVARGVLAALLGVLVLAFFRVQILQHRDYLARALSNKVRVVPLSAPRGFVFDRDGEILAENLPAYSASLLASGPEELERSMRVAAPLLGLDEAEVRELLSQGRVAPGQPVLLDHDLSFDALSSLEERRSEIPGLLIQSKPKRVYPWGPETAHVLGYVGQISEAELASSRDAYAPGDLVGQQGVERAYETNLRGKKGAEYREVDALGRGVGPFGEDAFQPPERGRDLRLTIDLDLQRVAAAEFPDSMKGAIVGLDPRNGDVLVLYSSPSFDPNLFSGRISRTTWHDVVENPERPLYNRAAQSRYPPGSTFKLAVAAMALAAGEAGPDTHMDVPCRGGYQYGRRWFGCWRSGHGSLDLVQALVQSCDGYFYQLGLRLGLEDFTRRAGEWGFREPTGLDLPGERGGIVPTSAAWYDERYGRGGWGPGVLLNLSIGQGEISQTPLKMAQFFAALLNGGHLLQPRVLRPEGSAAARTVVGRLPLDHDDLAVLRDAMAAVVNDARGTAYGALRRTPLLHAMGGKTGTAQFSGEEDYGWFLGFAPVEDPRIVVALVVEEGVHGSTVAPLAKRVMETYLEEEGIGRLELTSAPGPAPARGAAPAAVAAATPSAAPGPADGLATVEAALR